MAEQPRDDNHPNLKKNQFLALFILLFSVRGLLVVAALLYDYILQIKGHRSMGVVCTSISSQPVEKNT